MEQQNSRYHRLGHALSGGPSHRRRIEGDSATKRERPQQLIAQAPDVLGGIMFDASASPKHRIDSAKALDALAANGPESVPASDRFMIQINIGDVTERYKQINIY